MPKRLSAGNRFKSILRKKPSNEDGVPTEDKLTRRDNAGQLHAMLTTSGKGKKVAIKQVTASGTPSNKHLLYPALWRLDGRCFCCMILFKSVLNSACERFDQSPVDSSSSLNRRTISDFDSSGTQTSFLLLWRLRLRTTPAGASSRPERSRAEDVMEKENKIHNPLVFHFRVMQIDESKAIGFSRLCESNDFVHVSDCIPVVTWSSICQEPTQFDRWWCEQVHGFIKRLSEQIVLDVIWPYVAPLCRPYDYKPFLPNANIGYQTEEVLLRALHECNFKRTWYVHSKCSKWVLEKRADSPLAKYEHVAKFVRMIDPASVTDTGDIGKESAIQAVQAYMKDPRKFKQLVLSHEFAGLSFPVKADLSDERTVRFFPPLDVKSKDNREAVWGTMRYTDVVGGWECVKISGVASSHPIQHLSCCPEHDVLEDPHLSYQPMLAAQTKPDIAQTACWRVLMSSCMACFCCTTCLCLLWLPCVSSAQGCDGCGSKYVQPAAFVVRSVFRFKSHLTDEQALRSMPRTRGFFNERVPRLWSH